MDENIIKLNAGERSNDSETRNNWKNYYRCKRLDKPAICRCLFISLQLFLSLPFFLSFAHVLDGGVQINRIFIYFLIQNITLPIQIQNLQTNWPKVAGIIKLFNRHCHTFTWSCTKKKNIWSNHIEECTLHKWHKMNY